MGAWASLFVLGMVVTQTSPVEACAPSNDRFIVLVPAVLSFVGALAVAFWNRPSRDERDEPERRHPRRRRRAGNASER